MLYIVASCYGHGNRDKLDLAVVPLSFLKPYLLPIYVSLFVSIFVITSNSNKFDFSINVKLPFNLTVSTVDKNIGNESIIFCI